MLKNSHPFIYFIILFHCIKPKAFIVKLEDGIQDGQSEEALKQGGRDLVYLLLAQPAPLA